MIFLILVLEKLPDVTFSENPMRGTRLGCIHEGHSETLNEGKQRDGMSRHAKLPGNWENVLRNDYNKDELFQFLGQERVSKNPGHIVIDFHPIGRCR